MTGSDVLVIDDEPVVREAVRHVLGAQGLDVATAGTGAAGLAHPAAATCRLVLCDLMLPDRSGLDVLAEFLRRRPGLPVVLITGYATLDHEARAREAGATDFLAKPFEAKELLDTVRRALTCSGSAKERNA